MECNEARELLPLYIDNMLDESETGKVEEHLSACGGCRKEYNEIKEVIDLLGQTGLVPVPEAFRFRLTKALKEEKRKMIEEGIIGKPSKKSRWRVITSVAAVFAVGVISLGLYHDIFDILPDQFSGSNQAGTAPMEESAAADTGEMDLYGDDSGAVGDSAVTEEAADGLEPPSQQSAAKARTYGSAGFDGNAGSSDESADIRYETASGGGSQSWSGDPEPVREPAANTAKGSATPQEAAEAPSPGISPENISYDFSRSLTSSGVEREASTVEEYYNKLLEEKLKDFDYQLLGSQYAETGEWQFRVFIFHGKDGNTYNEEIMIIGKAGKIEVMDSNRLVQFE